MEITVTTTGPLNAERLAYDLRTALGVVYIASPTARFGDENTIRVILDDAATPEQQAIAVSVVQAYDPALLSPEQQEWQAVITAKHALRDDLALALTRLDQAETQINNFLAIATPTNAQVLAAVRAQHNRELIALNWWRRLLRLVEWMVRAIRANGGP